MKLSSRVGLSRVKACSHFVNGVTSEWLDVEW